MDSTTSLFGKLYCSERCNDNVYSKTRVEEYRSHISRVSERLKREVNYIK